MFTATLPESHREHEADQHWEEFIHPSQNGLPTEDTDAIELMLWRALRSVQFVGELPLIKMHAQQLAIVLRNTYSRATHSSFKRQYFDSPAPALLLITMVFTARYFQGNVAKFWEHFLVTALKVEADQNWQNALRECYRDALDTFNLNQPQLWKPLSDRQVVRAIYSHAVIPQYVEDDFARLVLYWRENQLHTRTVDQIIRDTPKTYLDFQAEPLKKFLHDDDYEDARRMLTDSVLAALQLHDEIGEVTAVRDLLSNPIQRAIWRSIENELNRLGVARAVTRRSSPPYLAWDSNAEELIVILPAQTLSKKTHPKPAYSTYIEEGRQVRRRLSPWEDEQNWITDRLMLPFAPEASSISLYDLQGRVIHKANVPQLLCTEFALYRPDASGETARLITDLESGLSDGEYWVSHADGVTLLNEQGLRIEPYEPLHVPHVMRQAASHTRGGKYVLTFPVTVVAPEGKVITCLGPPARTAPKLTFSGDLVDQTLSPDYPPVYSSATPLRIQVDAPTHIGKQLAALIRSGKDHTTLQFVVPSSGIARLDLKQHLNADFGTFELQLYAGTRPTGEPMKFAIASGIEVEGPPLDTVYSPVNLPRAMMTGVSGCSIQLSTAGLVEEEGDILDIQWLDLREAVVGCILTKDSKHVEFRWTPQRVWAWLENTQSTLDRMSLNDLRQAVVHVRGGSRAWAKWLIADKSHLFQLNARGEYHNEIKLDSLGEMLRYTQEDSEVGLSVAHIQWALFHFAAAPTLVSAKVTQTTEAPTIPSVPDELEDYRALSQAVAPYRRELARSRFPETVMARILSTSMDVFCRLEMPALIGDPQMSWIYNSLRSRDGINALDTNGVLGFIIDREYARRSFTERLSANKSSNIISPTERQGYCRAVDEWVLYYRDPRFAMQRKLLDQIVHDPVVSYETADWLWTRTDIPMIAHASRVWQILHVREDDDRLLRLDRRVFLVALMLRFQAHYPADAAELFDVADLKLQPFADVFGKASRGCNKLMAWALGWAEICHDYSEDYDTEDDSK